MACGLATVHLQYVAATTVTCRGFQAHKQTNAQTYEPIYEPINETAKSLPPVFALGNYQIVVHGKAAAVVEPASGELPAGLLFDGQGIQVKLPTPTVAVTVQVGSCLGQSIAVVAVDSAGQRIDQRVAPGDGSLHTLTLVGTDLDSLYLVGEGGSGRLVLVCGASSTMQTILEDYFDPSAQPIRLLPYIEAARRLFVSYYLRPQEIILQGRLGSSDSVTTPCAHNLWGHKLAAALGPPHLGYDGFYMHTRMKRVQHSVHMHSAHMESTHMESTQRYPAQECGTSAGGCLSPDWQVIREIALTLPLTVAAPTLLATVARAAGVAVAEIVQHEWVMKKAVAALVEVGFSHKIAAVAIPHLTAGAELAAAWLICSGALD